MIVEHLLKGGTKLENITLLCAMGLHRVVLVSGKRACRSVLS
jgi:nickel-dependent lactate racemase